jgi:hypothetical protein
MDSETVSQFWVVFVISAIGVCLFLQTCLLVLIYFTVDAWASKLNRKLHRLESLASRAFPEQEDNPVETVAGRE